MCWRLVAHPEGPQEMTGTTEVLGTTYRYAQCQCRAIVFEGNKHKCGSARQRRESDQIAIRKERQQKQKGLFEDDARGQEVLILEHGGRDHVAEESGDSQT